jgi:hypothetical protein
MANEAFALSPISARAAEPTEADYDAIREAFMETARGRWFLGEYAKRNRNADTRMVLDAVAKIEETLAAQRQPVVEDRLPEALVAIRRAIRVAETVAISAVDPGVLETSLGPIHRGIRIIKEISWRWREIGADGRICDLIDSQLTAIEGACAQITTIDPRAELKSAFDLLKDEIEQADKGGGAAPQAAAVRPAPAQETPEAAEVAPAEAETAMASETPAVVAEAPQEVAASPEPEAAAALSDVAGVKDVVEAMELAGETETAEVAESHIAIEESVAEPAAVAEMVEELPLDTATEAEDEAILERIALEMAAPDPDFDEALIRRRLPLKSWNRLRRRLRRRSRQSQPLPYRSRPNRSRASAMPSPRPLPRCWNLRHRRWFRPLHMLRRFPCRRRCRCTPPCRSHHSARPFLRAACCRSRTRPPTIPWRRSAA